ncbi:MAG: cell wall hydrolase [Syntrophales bacterium]|nr:cell wall hydrolase [Syntrophales bacterium]
MKPEHRPIFHALDDSEAAVLTIYGEARGEPFEGMQAVGCVIANRAERWRKTIKQVVFAPNQFSCYLSSDPNYTRLLLIAEEMATGTYRGSLQQSFKAWKDDSREVGRKIDYATFYRVPGTKNPWFDKQVAIGKLIKTAEIGHHEFFKEKEV